MNTSYIFAFRRILVLLAATLLVACSDDTGEVEVNTDDNNGGESDAALGDDTGPDTNGADDTGSSSDSGSPSDTGANSDTGVDDTGGTDSGVQDTGAADTGSSSDSGTLGRACLQISDSNKGSYSPYAFTHGGAMDLIWMEEEAAGTNFDYRFASASASGSVQIAPKTFNAPAAAAHPPRAAWNGSEYGIAWSDTRPTADSNDLYFGRMSDQGDLVGSELPLATDQYTSWYGAIAWNDNANEYGVLWVDSRDWSGDWKFDVYFRRVSSSGTKLGDDVRVTSVDSVADLTGLVWTGSEYGAVWMDKRDANFAVYFVRLSADGTKIGTPKKINGDTASASDPSIVWTGSGYGIAWSDGRHGDSEIYLARLDSDATLLGEYRVTDHAGASSQATLAWTGYSYGVVWQDDRAGSPDVYFREVTALGPLYGGVHQVNCGDGDATSPTLAWLDNAFGIAWSDDSDGNLEIYGTFPSAKVAPE